MFEIKIETDNAAFETEYECKREIKRLLKLVLAQLDCGHTSSFLRDINGNRVGSFEFDSETVKSWNENGLEDDV